MSRKKADDNTVDAEALGFTAPVDPTAGEAGGVFDQLLTGTDDDDQAVELTEEEQINLGDNYRVVANLTRRKKKLEAKLKDVSAALTAAKQGMQSAMVVQGTKQFRGAEDDGSCTVATRYDTKVTDPVSFINWVMGNAHELLSVNSQTRTRYIRENFKDKGIPVDSEAFPPGIEASEGEFLQVRGVRDTDVPEEQST